MPRRNPANVDERIAALHREKHATTRQIATALAREGIQITPSGVHRVLSRLGLAAPRKAPGSKGSPVASLSGPLAPVSSPAAADEGSEDDIPTRLRRVLASLERAALQAEQDKDVARIVASQRAITQAAALLAKATPPPPIDVDARPDMVAAAKRAREHIHAAFDRLLGSAT